LDGGNEMPNICPAPAASEQILLFSRVTQIKKRLYITFARNKSFSNCYLFYKGRRRQGRDGTFKHEKKYIPLLLLESHTDWHWQSIVQSNIRTL
jgi:hypothetical protein